MFRSILLALLITVGFISCKNDRPVQIPEAAYNTWNYIQKNNKPQNGYVGGRTFRNFEQLLPQVNVTRQKLQYREWDIYPKRQGKNRGAERLVTSSDGRAYFTPDHYQSFIPLQ
jgi:ribonuclease T1